MRNRLLTLFLTLLAILALAACSSYYKITDPATGKVYYADDIEEDDGAVIFEDPNTGGTVTLDSSEVIEVNEEEYKANTPKD